MKRRRQLTLGFAPLERCSDGTHASLQSSSEAAEQVPARARLRSRELTGPGLRVTYTHAFLDRGSADALLDHFLRKEEFEAPAQTAVLMFGQRVAIPRDQVAFGDTGLAYKFSGAVAHARPWPPVLDSIRTLLEDEFPEWRFNFVLVNRYADGLQYMGFHRDDEDGLHPEAPIASVSLGAERDFVFQHRDSRRRSGPYATAPKRVLRLAHGSLLVMHAPTNRSWYHALPKRTTVTTARVNLTFRVMRHHDAGPPPPARHPDQPTSVLPHQLTCCHQVLPQQYPV